MKKNLRSSTPQLLLAALAYLLTELLGAGVNLALLKLMDQALAGDKSAVLRAGQSMLWLLLAMFPAEALRVLSKTYYYKTAMLRARTYYVERVFRKNINEFQEENNARYLSNLTNDMNSIENKYVDAFYQVLTGMITFLTSIALISYISWSFLLIGLFLSVMMAILSFALGKPLQKMEAKKSEFLARYTTYLQEVFSAFNIIKNNNLEERVTESFAEHSGKVQQEDYRIDRKATVFNALQQFVIMASLLGLVLLALAFAMRGLLTAGAVIVIMNSMAQILQPLMNFSEFIPKIKSVDALFKNMDRNLENLDQHEEHLSIDALTDALFFDHVSYAYEDHIVLQDISPRFLPGKKYLIVEPSGGGKSTLLKMLRKYFAPSSGQIFIDGQDLYDTKKEDYFRLLANVEQHVFLFEDSLRNNITLFKDYSHEAIHQAIHLAGLDSYLASLEDGLDHILLDNGKNVSGGERARIAIARGLIAQADMILLDEAFASLDEAVARRIEQSLLQVTNVMVVNVSHVFFKDTLSQYDEVLLLRNKTLRQIDESTFSGENGLVYRE